MPIRPEMRMTPGRFLSRPALILLLGLACTAAGASGLRPLSESEMSQVYGQGLAAALLNAQEQGAAYASAGDALAAMSSLTADGARNLDRELSLQQVQAATAGLQTSIRLAQTLGATSAVAANVTIPVLPVFLFGLPAMPDLAATLAEARKH
jgi:hypothetical protein